MLFIKCLDWKSFSSLSAFLLLVFLHTLPTALDETSDNGKRHRKTKQAGDDPFIEWGALFVVTGKSVSRVGGEGAGEAAYRQGMVSVGVVVRDVGHFSGLGWS